ncbi:orphan protein [Pandoravirus kuranda]|uniref:Orphan protein n=1 Tax=Pandoravirus kuranda TaxID=3019033 RepID=A0AA95ECY0_9VIRU|nr:orphan protein [Pandoravirus kuranda]
MRLQRREGPIGVSKRHGDASWMADVEGDVVGVDDAERDDLDDDTDDRHDDRHDDIGDVGDMGDGPRIDDGDGGGDDAGGEMVDVVDDDDDRETDEKDRDDDSESDDDRVSRDDVLRSERAEVNGDVRCGIDSPSSSLRSVRWDLAHEAKLRHTDRGERATDDVDDRLVAR